METVIVCRCEDITEEDIVEAIHAGYTDFEELRKNLRIGMGPCQGRVCIPLVRRILQRELGRKIKENPTMRPPVIPIPLGMLAMGWEDEE